MLKGYYYAHTLLHFFSVADASLLRKQLLLFKSTTQMLQGVRKGALCPSESR